MRVVSLLLIAFALAIRRSGGGRDYSSGRSSGGSSSSGRSSGGGSSSASRYSSGSSSSRSGYSSNGVKQSPSYSSHQPVKKESGSGIKRAAAAVAGGALVGSMLSGKKLRGGNNSGGDDGTQHKSGNGIASNDYAQYERIGLMNDALDALDQKDTPPESDEKPKTHVHRHDHKHKETVSRYQPTEDEGPNTIATIWEAITDMFNRR